jgi:hypothetical protein
VRISEKDLRAQFDRTMANWSWIRYEEDRLSIPPFLLFALGSRETNLRNINSADGHGRGIWQRDDRSFTIPGDYLDTPSRQANDAATLLASHFGRFRGEPILRSGQPWLYAVCAYNGGYGGVSRALAAGKTADSVTTGGDYGSDVWERWSFLTRWGWNRI